MATNLADPVVLLTLAQTVVLTLTMVVFILQFRSQNEAIKDAAYQKALDDQTESFRMLVENPDLGATVDEMRSAIAGGEKLDPLGAKRAVFGYMLINYSIFERVYLLYAKKWIDKETWDQWYTWLKQMAKHPMFQEVHRRSQGTFDRAFQEMIEQATKAA
jgi:hypothetical protein